MKKKACSDAGIVSFGLDFDANVAQEELLEAIRKLNLDPAVHGILLQLPLPSIHLDEDQILRAIDPAKDVDGLHPVNVAALQLYDGNDYDHAPFTVPCTPLGCLELLDRCHVKLCGQRCVVVGRSRLVGLPLARMLLGRNATVTVVHSQTVDPASIVREADVVVVAVGRPGLVKDDWIKPGAVVIDVGINAVDNEETAAEPPPTAAASEEGANRRRKKRRLVGDVDFDAVRSKCRLITPVPGGVGPMTIATLIAQTVEAAEKSA